MYACICIVSFIYVFIFFHSYYVCIYLCNLCIFSFYIFLTSLCIYVFNLLTISFSNINCAFYRLNQVMLKTDRIIIVIH